MDEVKLYGASFQATLQNVTLSAGGSSIMQFRINSPFGFSKGIYVKKANLIIRANKDAAPNEYQFIDKHLASIRNTPFDTDQFESNLDLDTVTMNQFVINQSARETNYDGLFLDARNNKSTVACFLYHDQIVADTIYSYADVIDISFFLRLQFRPKSEV